MSESNINVKNDTKNKEIVPIIPHALCICLRCKKLCLMKDDFWIPVCSGQVNKENGNYTNRQTNLILHLNKNSTWKFQTNYEAFLDLSFLKNQNFFPVCPKCYELLNAQISSNLSFYRDRISFYSSLPKDKVNYVQAAESNLQTIENETSVINEVLLHQKEELEKHIKFECSLTDDDLNCHSIEPPESDHHDSVIKTNPILPSITCGAFGLVISFHISTNRFYGCINKRKIGTLTPSHFSPKEFDQGLYFLAQLVQKIAVLSNIDASCLILSDKIYISKQSSTQICSKLVPIQSAKVQMPNDESESSLHSMEMSREELRVSGSADTLTSKIKAISLSGVSDFDSDFLVLTTNELRFGRGVDDFNTALLLFLQFVSKVIHSDLFFGKYEPVLNLAPDGSMIDGVPFLYDKRNPENFVHAMKLLLCELKRIQLKALQYEMSRFS